MSDGRLAIARIIGYGEDARHAHLALIELAAAICRPETRSCNLCPLSTTCASSQENSQSK
jgi:DNA (cytosine-5)-methyltransferase 1